MPANVNKCPGFSSAIFFPNIPSTKSLIIQAWDKAFVISANNIVPAKKAYTHHIFTGHDQPQLIEE